MKQIIDEKTKMTLKENGKWWDKNSTIDVVLGDESKVMFANCFWTDEIVEKDKLDKLENSAKKINAKEKQYYLFAKKGFSDELKKLAKKREDIELIDFNTIVEGKKKFFLFK